MNTPQTTPDRYRKEPVEIEAIQWDGTADGAARIIDWILGHGSTATYTCSNPDRCSENDGDTPHSIAIRTLEGTMRADLGDWIIRGVQGEFYPCKPDIFEQTYEPAAVARVVSPSARTVDEERRNRYAAPLFTLMRQNGWDGERTEPVVREMDLVLDAVLAVADVEQATIRAAALHEAADECDTAGAAYTARAQNEHAAGAFTLMETFLRKANQVEYVATPCDFVACEPGGEPCDTHERLMAHGEGDHELCGPDCGTPLRRMADEEQQPEHSCPNCDGIDPDTCFTNPDRPPEQCPAAEFEDYGQQCQKPVGHEFHTFEEQPTTNTPEAEPDVVTAIVTALQQRAVELSDLAEEEMRPSLEERAQEWSEAAEVARRAARAAAASQPVAPFVPPVHYLRDDGVECCVHATPVGPDSCGFCRELAEDGPAAVAEPGKETDGPRTVCVCGHTRGEHVTVSGRLLCDECDPDSTDNLTCKEFEAL